MGLEASLLYHLDPKRAADVYQQIGPNYSEVLLQPTFRSAIRAITAGNNAASLYSDARETIARADPERRGPTGGAARHHR